METEKYRMLYDYHTHTTFSHGKGSIEDNVKAAKAVGLSGIAISDHGPGHLTYGIKRSAPPIMRKECERLKEKYPDMDIFLSVEANIVNNGNYLDVSKEEYPQYDFVLAGYHYGVTHGYCIGNWIGAHILGRESKRLLIKNTDMAVKAIYENEIKILTHPGDKGPFDIEELAKACADRGTLMEISTWHPHLTTEEIVKAAKYDVSFIISSDAHTPDRVGSFQGGLKRAMEAEIDLNRIVNIEKID